MPPADRRPRDPAEKALREQEAQLARQTAISDMQWLMGDVRGRRFVWRLLEEAGIYRSSWTGDALSMAFREGERNRGLRLMDELVQHCPQRLSKMQRENLKNATNSEGNESGSAPATPAG